MVLFLVLVLAAPVEDTLHYAYACISESLLDSILSLPCR